jgi:hypothetical protein
MAIASFGDRFLVKHRLKRSAIGLSRKISIVFEIAETSSQMEPRCRRNVSCSSWDAVLFPSPSETRERLAVSIARTNEDTKTMWRADVRSLKNRL